MFNSFKLTVVGPHSIPRLPVFSFLVWHRDSGRYLHHNFVCAILNDVFGIQTRGGCSCAGPYSQVRGVVSGCGQRIKGVWFIIEITWYK